MFISRLRADDQRPSTTPVRVADPALEEVEAAIKRLDGFYFTEVTLLGNEEETSLHITGGREGRYLCQMISDEDVKILVDPSNPSRETVFILENRQGDYPRRLTV